MSTTIEAISKRTGASAEKDSDSAKSQTISTRESRVLESFKRGAEQGRIYQATASPKPAGSDKGKAAKKRRLRTVLIVIGAIILVFVMIPKAFHAWHTVSTDDAYVNSYVTFVAPRVSGQISRALVDDNNRVKKGDVLVELDPESYRVQVAIKQAAVDTARANLVVAQATVRSQLGQARSLRFKLQHTIEDVDNQIALIRARVATWEQSKAKQRKCWRK